MSEPVEGEAAKVPDKKKKKKVSKTEEKRKQSVKETNEDETPQPPTEVPNEIDKENVESVAEIKDTIIGEIKDLDQITESQDVTNLANEIQEVNKEKEEVVENEEEKEELPAAEIITKETKGTVKEEKQKQRNFPREEDLQMLCELKEAFHLFDVNHDGVIDLEDLKIFYGSIGIPDFPIDQMNKMLAERSEPMDFDAFVNLFGCKFEMCMDPEEVFTKALAKWDMRDKGYISERRFKRDLELRGPDFFSLKDIETALEEAPIHVDNGKSLIDYQAFSNNICGMQNMPECRKYQKMNNDV